MFDRVTIRVTDREASERFYDVVLGSIGVDKTSSTAAHAEWGDFALVQAGAPTTGLHVAFTAGSRHDVDSFWDRGIEAGYQADGEPGVRPQYRSDYYGAFLLDPDGNSVEAVIHGGVNRQGNIDHLWIRVADLEATRAFYEAISPYTGYPLLWEHPDRVHFGAMGSHFALVADSRPITRNLQIAFGADSDETVDAFQRAARAAGHTENGAYVLDPAGASVEVVTATGG